MSLTPAPARFYFFFFNDTATTEIYTLSLHDALPISLAELPGMPAKLRPDLQYGFDPFQSASIPTVELRHGVRQIRDRSEEHTSELQSQSNLVCRLLLEKKKKYDNYTSDIPNNTLYLF